MTQSPGPPEAAANLPQPGGGTDPDKAPIFDQLIKNQARVSVPILERFQELFPQ